MRQIYKKGRMVMPINQGSIINHCLANAYPDSASVYGLVITARCDIAHDCKVNWVHYLPIVNYGDWLKRDAQDYWFNKWSEKRIKKFQQECQKHRFPDNLDKLSLYQTMATNRIHNKNDRDNFLESATIRFNLSKTHSNFLDYIKKQDTKSSIIDNLLRDDLPDYYLLEDWKVSRNEPKIILLREMKRISIQTARLYSSGFGATDIDKNTDELRIASADEELYRVCAEITSPFIEHIIQRFSHIFCRIGVDDRDESQKENLQKITNYE